MAATDSVLNAYPQIMTLPEPDSCVSGTETPQEPLIQAASTPQASPLLPPSSTPACTLQSDVPELILKEQDPVIKDTQDEQTPTTDDMAESTYSYYSGLESESPYVDAQSDIESIYETQCEQARTVRFLHAGRPSIVDLMRADKPVFKHASKMIVRRPVERPFISPIQPPNNSRRSFSGANSSSDSEESSSSSCSKESDKSSEPSTPILDDEDGSSTHTSDRSPFTPDTPRSSYEQEHRLPRKSSTEIEAHSPSFKSKMSSRLRFLPKRSSSMNVDVEAETLRHGQRLPTLFTGESMRSRTNLPTIQASPHQEPSIAPHIPPRSSWRDAGKSKFLGHKVRRVDSRVGLQAH